jgi:ferritin-like protein
MCHPFKPYNLTKQGEIDILEIPLTLMDKTLNEYMKLDANRVWEMTKRLIDTFKMYHDITNCPVAQYLFFWRSKKIL